MMKETIMPDYEICYLHEDGSLAGKFAAHCDTDMQAKIFAHAMRLDNARQIEVWTETRLIYRRPGEPIEQSAA
jgi:hypothetical protein